MARYRFTIECEIIANDQTQAESIVDPMISALCDVEADNIVGCHIVEIADEDNGGES